MNGLAQSDSAYLQQHAHNPVQWWPWSAESLEAAAAKGQWLLVSIGYSACHWCHVMEREIFEDAECAAYMNAHFRNIKVDREERPDVDQAYMAAALALSGQGGWPLNVVCLPDGRPIWASTYLPKDRWLAALAKLVEIRDHHADVPGPYAQKLVDALEGAALPASADGLTAWAPEAWPWTEDAPAWDPDHGGLRGAPKFPLPALWASLHRLPPHAPYAAAQTHSVKTLRAIFHSGSYDALRGGLFRYSTDAAWHVPHFEKMAYDNGLWLRWAAQIFSITGDTRDRRAFEATANWLLREMQRSDGLFCAALDADTDGKEGASYVWTEAELEAALGSPRSAEALNLLRAQGPTWEGSHVLHWHPLEGRPSEAWTSLLDVLRPAALARPLPFRDDKSVHAWNAWIGVGLLEGALHIPAWKESALGAAEAHMAQFGPVEGRCAHVSYSGKPAQGWAFLDDLAGSLALCMAAAQLSLDPRWIARSEALLAYADEHHWDGHAYLYAAKTQPEPAFLAQYDWEDDVLPSAQAQLARALIYVGHLRTNPGMLERAKDLVARAAHVAASPAQSMSWWSLVPSLAPGTEHLLLPASYSHPVRIPAHWWLWGPAEAEVPPFGQVCHESACTLAFETESSLHAYLQSL